MPACPALRIDSLPWSYYFTCQCRHYLGDSSRVSRSFRSLCAFTTFWHSLFLLHLHQWRRNDYVMTSAISVSLSLDTWTLHEAMEEDGAKSVPSHEATSTWNNGRLFLSQYSPSNTNRRCVGDLQSSGFRTRRSITVNKLDFESWQLQSQSPICSLFKLNSVCLIYRTKLLIFVPSASSVVYPSSSINQSR